MTKRSEPPWPLVAVSIEPKVAADRVKLAGALKEMTVADAAFRVVHNPDIDTHFVLGGVDESHLDTKVGVLRHAYGIEVAIGTPQVAYRETLKRRVEKDYTHKKRAVGGWEFARVKIDFAPIRMDAAPVLESRVAGGAVPDDFIPAVETGVASAMASGLLAGFPVVGVRATLLDGAFHDTDSSAVAFEIAGRAACREALRDGGSLLLEPIMRVEVTTPEDYTGAIVHDLAVRRGQVRYQTATGDGLVIEGTGVPFANLFGYANQLRSLSQGKATFTMRYMGYRPVPNRGDDGPHAAAIGLRA